MRQNKESHYRQFFSQEAIILLAIFALFLVINYFTSLRYPVVWIDEVMFVDPAINYHLGLGFTSTAWPYQAHDHYFAGYPPLYSWLIAAWIFLGSSDPTHLRTFNYLLIVLTALIIVIASARKQWIPRPIHRIGLALLILAGYGVSMGYRSDRPDTLMLFLSASVLLASTLHPTFLRRTAVFAIATLFPFAGLQLVAYAGLTSLLLLIYLKKDFFSDFFTFNTGMLLGLIALLAMYSGFDVLPEFIEAMRGGADNGFVTELLKGNFDHKNALPKDFSLAILFPVALFTFYKLHKANILRNAPLFSFALVASVTIPSILVIIGKFPTYYSWTIYVPLCIAVMANFPAQNSRFSAILTTSLSAVCLVGFPFEMLMISHDWDDRSHDKVVSTVRQHVQPSDRVLTDYGAYFAVKGYVARVYSPQYTGLLTSDEKNSLSVFIASEEFYRKAVKIIGGQWHPVASIAPQLPLLTERMFGTTTRFGMFDRKYDFKIYRRNE